MRPKADPAKPGQLSDRRLRNPAMLTSFLAFASTAMPIAMPLAACFLH